MTKPFCIIVLLVVVYDVTLVFSDDVSWRYFKNLQSKNKNKCDTDTDNITVNRKSPSVSKVCEMMSIPKCYPDDKCYIIEKERCVRIGKFFRRLVDKTKGDVHPNPHITEEYIG